MKKILLVCMMLGATTFAFANDYKKVTVSEGRETVFRFTGLITGDSCNSISVIPDMTLISHDKKRKVKVYQFSYSIMSTVMGCLDDKTTEHKMTSSEMRTKRGETVIFLIEPNMELEIIR